MADIPTALADSHAIQRWEDRGEADRIRQQAEREARNCDLPLVGLDDCEHCGEELPYPSANIIGTDCPHCGERIGCTDPVFDV